MVKRDLLGVMHMSEDKAYRKNSCIFYRVRERWTKHGGLK